MAASTKPTAVHFSLVVFVMTTLILALVCYLIAKENGKLTIQNKEASDRATTQTAALDNAIGEINTLKRWLGYVDFKDVGNYDTPLENTVSSAVKRDLTMYGMDQVQPNPQSPNVAATLQSLRTALNEIKLQAQAEQAGVQETRQRLAQEQAMHLAEKEKIANSQANSEKQLQDIVSQRNEMLGSKDTEIAKWRGEFLREQVEKEQVRDELVAVRRTKDQEITELENQIDFMRQQLYDLENLSFDKPDGSIVRVDNTTRTVWINLGSDDNLRKQTTFSVYTKNNYGVGRGKADIKAKIEITNIRDHHLAEARILSEDISRPIQIDDPIYSPAWTKGNKEYFSFVGILDLDGDGISDRELLHSILDNSRSGVEVEVNDQGVRSPENQQLTVKTKWLVVGEIPDPSKFPLSNTEKQQEIQSIMTERDALLKEARRQGIRVVKFSDFLSYLGYEQQQRLYNVGDERPFNLQTGARRTAVDEAKGAGRLSKDQIPPRFRQASPKN